MGWWYSHCIVGGSITVSIGNSGSGYRTGLGTIFVGVQTSSLGTPNITTIGTATISNGNVTGVTITNLPGTGFTGTDLPELVIDEPHSYTNIPLVYSSTTVRRSWSIELLSIFKWRPGGSVIDYQLKQEGFAYGNGEILTVPVGGATGIPTSGTFSEFQITIDEIYNDDFNGFSIGQLQVLDNFDSNFDGKTRTFRLSVNDLPLSIQSAPGSPVEVDKTLLIFINDVLQQPEDPTTSLVVVLLNLLNPHNLVTPLRYCSTRVVEILMLSLLMLSKLSRLVTT